MAAASRNRRGEVPDDVIPATGNPAARDGRRLALAPSVAPSDWKAALSTAWETAAYRGRVIPSHPGAERVAVEVLLRDRRGETLRLHACGFTVDDAIAAAEAHAARRFGSEYASCDWRRT